MNDVDRWVYFDGPVPETIRPLLDALEEITTPRPTAEDKARVTAALLEKIDARYGCASERRAEPARVRVDTPVVHDGAASGPKPRAPAEPLIPTPTLAPSPPSSARVSFEAWVELSIRLIGAREEDKLEAISARGVSLEEWTRIDDDYLRALTEDRLAGRTDRHRLYAARCDEEIDRRARRLEAPVTGAASAEAAGGPASRSLKSTAEALDLPASVREAMGRLPFQAAAPDSAAPRKGAVKTLQVPVMRRSLDETLPIGSDAIQKAMAAMPFAGSTGGAAIVPFPALTLQQYVSLCVDLKMRPEWSAETLRRYGVPSEASRRALDEHWAQQIAERPELEAQLDAAAEAYRQWLTRPPA